MLTANDIVPLILVVEDNPQVCRVLQMLLTRQGYRVELAADGSFEVPDWDELTRKGGRS